MRKKKKIIIISSIILAITATLILAIIYMPKTPATTNIIVNMYAPVDDGPKE